MFVGFGQNDTGKKKQNVIFILADDLGWKDLSSYGSDFYETPNIDALAKDGLLFTDAYAASPLCSPTRASILTGQEPGRLRFTTPSGHVPQVVLDPEETFTAGPHDKTATPQTRTRLPNEYLTFAEVMKEEGYATAFMGKWHLGREPYVPENQGFDTVIGGREHPGPPGPGHFFAPWNAETLPVVPDGTHISDVLTDQAMLFIDNNKNEPFLLCLWYYDVHAPFQAKPELIEKYRNKLNPDHIQRSPTMAAMIETMDSNIGRVIKQIKDLQLEDETIIIFTSDNGGNMYDGPDNTNPTNNYPLRAGKGSNYEGGVRVPLIIKVPGITKAGTLSNVITSTVDHYASLLELLDIPYPNDQVTDGVSYAKALYGTFYNREPMYSTFAHNVLATGNRANISLRKEQWKFYKFYYDGEKLEHRYELYNLSEDLSESNNLSTMMPEKVLEFNNLLDAHVKEAGILLPNKNKDYAGNSADAWWGSEQTEVSVVDHMLKTISTGEKPKIETFYTPNVSDGIFYFKFDGKSTGTGNGSIAWTTVQEKKYLPENNTAFEMIHDDQWHSYTIKIPLQGRLSTIQINPLDNKGNILMKNLRLVNEGSYLIRDWPLY